MQRIFYFLVTNVAVLAVLFVVMHLVESMFGISLSQTTGLNIPGLLIIALIFGMGGSVISLALSKWSAKRMSGAQVIKQARTDTEMFLVNTVQRLAQQAGIGMPEVAIFNSPQPNAFATGMKRNNALVAVSTGLLDNMSRDEVEAVLGHEIAHVANGDMITLTLIQGVLNTFVIFFARLVGYFVDRVVLKNDRGVGLGYYATSIIAQIIFGILASMIVMWFSRRREFRADAGGAQYAGRQKMINALEKLKRGSDAAALPSAIEAFGINGQKTVGWKRAFMSHPPLDERIAALQAGQVPA